MNYLIFGYGYMGRIRHLALRRRPDTGVVYVVDPALDASAAAASEVMLVRIEDIPWNAIDAVFVCTPNNATAKMCVLGLQMCGHVFCEKPPGRNWEDFTLIADAAAQRRDHVLVFGFNHRLHPMMTTASALVGPGGLGDVLYVKGTYGKSGGANFRKSWRNDQAVSGGGILLDQGIHMLDLFSVFIGRMQLVDAVLVDSFWEANVEDNAFVLLRSAQGVPAFLHSSATLWKHTFRLELGCRDGYAIATGLLSQSGSYGREQLTVGRRQFEDEALALGNPREEIIYFDRDDSWDLEVGEFVSAIAEGRPARHGTLEDARHVMALIRDVYARLPAGVAGRPR